MKNDINTILKKHTNNIVNTLYTLLFVGTKQLLTYTRPRTPPLSNQDTLLLTVLFWSHYFTLGKENLRIY